MNRVQIIPKKVTGTMSVPFPSGATSFIGVGENVLYGQQLYEMKRKKVIDSYYLPRILGIKAENSPDYVGRISGEYVVTGDLLAEKLTAAGMIGRRVVAGKDGVVDLSRITQGFLRILGEEEVVQVNSHLQGKVVGLELNRRLTIETDGAQISYTYGHQVKNAVDQGTEEISGELLILGDGSSVYSKRDLLSTYENKIVFAGRFIYQDLAREIYKRNAKIIIVNAIDQPEMKQLKVPLVILGGFGQVPLDKEILSILQNSVGHQVKVEPNDNSLVIANQPAIDPSSFKGNSYFLPKLVVGTLAKVYDPSNYGVVGEVIDLMDEDEKFLIETRGKKRLMVDKNSVEGYITKV